jgi:hypothetical protein
VSSLLCLALVGVYAVGVAGVVVAGSLPGSRAHTGTDLDERLAVVRETATPEDTIIAHRPRRRADTRAPRRGAVESIARAFAPVVPRRMRSDVAASGSFRSARSR